MAGWEYRVIEFRHGVSSEDMESELDKAGHDEYELVSTHVLNEAFVAFLKRPSSSTPGLRRFPRLENPE